MLESNDQKWHYYGYTSDLKKRYGEHCEGAVASTKHHRPFKLRYYEAYDFESLARRREQMLKQSRSATKAILSRINNKGA
ncbi:MAG: GIY-YIG nuclease family protein [Candidatus Saccharibacteria bacterium]